MYYVIRRDSELYHYGIKGQKWGIRKYQNEDGTLTEEGKKRYNTYSGARRAEVEKIDKKLNKSYIKTEKKFDKHTEKILRDKAAGKKISKNRIYKAINLGTEHRKIDRIARNPDKYYDHIIKGNKAKDKALGITYAGGSLAVGANLVKSIFDSNSSDEFFDNFTSSPLAWVPLASIVAAPVIGQSAKINEEYYDKAYGEYGKYAKNIYDKSEKETIEDLKKRGIID